MSVGNFKKLVDKIGYDGLFFYGLIIFTIVIFPIGSLIYMLKISK
jgi:hypothetical protein